VRRVADVSGKPGEIVGIGDTTISIATQGGVIELAKVRTASGEKLSAAEFAAAQGLLVGDKFESEEAKELAPVG